jgi:EAL domain-containing protein (putative c-di-GMP-specific phosphodiesterase class I)
VGHHTCTVGASIGIACYPQHGENTEQLLKNADMAMYKAKDKGRNQSHFFSEILSEQSRKSFEVEIALKDAIQHATSQFSLHYQPKVNLTTGEIASVEALIRWEHPTLGHMSPDKFIPIAEEIGLIEQIDEWVLRQACQQLKQWQTGEHASVVIAINISGRSFNHSRFVSNTVMPILQEYQVKGDHLEIEITESVLLTDIEQVHQRLIDLKKLGLRIAIDDFGTGFSSLNYLSNLPIDTLKIDGTFMCDMSSSDKDQAVLKAIIALGNALNINVVAECVENSNQLELLQTLHCNEGQGWFWGKPAANWSLSESNQQQLLVG